jgi:hypothetical protein
MMGPGPVMAPPPSDGRRGEGEDEADPDDDGSGNDNRMIPLFRGMMKKYGAGLLVCSVGFLVILIIEAAALWNMRPSWIKKVPCVLQPKLARVESTLKGIERYFLLSGMVSPAATCVFILVHLIASRARTDRDYEPPSARWMILIWSWKILTPLVGAGPAARTRSFAVLPRRAAAARVPRSDAACTLVRTRSVRLYPGESGPVCGLRGHGAKTVRGVAVPHPVPAGYERAPVRFTARARFARLRLARGALGAGATRGGCPSRARA